MNAVVRLLVWRYITHTKSEKSLSIMILICFLGIFLGSFALAVITAIMNGFEKDVYEKMQGIHAHIQISSHTQPLNVDALQKVLDAEFPQVRASSPTSSGYLLIPTNNNDLPMVIVLKAIDPQAEEIVSTLGQKVLGSTATDAHPLQHALANNRVLIGKKLAQELHLSLDNKVTLLYPEAADNERTNAINLSKHTAQIGGMFSTGIDEYDANVMFCTFDFFNQLFPDLGVTHLNLRLHNDNDESSVLSHLKNRLGLQVCSWKELYPALVSALTLQKYVSFLIILLITLVAAMNILSLLFMEITSKRAHIAILHVMGMKHHDISSIFIYMGVGIALIASTLGIICTYLVDFGCKRYPFITLPDVYYSTQLPIHMEWRIALAVLVAVFAISFFASWLPTRRINTLNIAQILRSEQ
jgi:lipoprotein-releasing system permease protein